MLGDVFTIGSPQIAFPFILLHFVADSYHVGLFTGLELCRGVYEPFQMLMGKTMT
jgi:hypothetical protein